MWAGRIVKAPATRSPSFERPKTFFDENNAAIPEALEVRIVRPKVRMELSDEPGPPSLIGHRPPVRVPPSGFVRIMRQSPSVNWDDLRIFLEVHRHGSHAAAARALKINATTVARRVAALESDVGAKLFLRTPEGQDLTDEGARILEAVERMERGSLEIERRLSSEDASLEGMVRVATSSNVAAEFLIEALAPLRASHPGLIIEYAEGTAFVDLTRAEADLAVRFAPASTGVPTQHGADVLIARKLGVTEVGVYTHPDYLAERGTPEGDDYTGHDIVGRTENALRLPGGTWITRASTHARISIRCDSFRSTRAAVEAGYGLGAFPSFMAAGRPNLVRIGELPEEAQTGWLLMHVDLKDTPRVRAVVNAITRAYEQSPV